MTVKAVVYLLLVTTGVSFAQSKKNTTTMILNMIADAELYTAADSLYQAGEYDKAVTKFTQYLEAHPQNKGALFARAHCRQMTEDTSGALQDYDRLIGLDSSYVMAFRNRGLIHYSRQDYDAAMRDAQRVVQLRPMESYGYFNWGLVAIGKSEFDTAVEKFGEAIRRDSTFADAWFNRGAVRLVLNQKKEACADWQRAMELGYRAAEEVLKQFCR